MPLRRGNPSTGKSADQKEEQDFIEKRRKLGGAALNESSLEESEFKVVEGLSLAEL